jgi:hypothetical protein
LLQFVFAYIWHSSDVELEQEGERSDEVAVGSYEKKFADLLNKEMLRIHDFFKAKIGEASYFWAFFLARPCFNAFNVVALLSHACPAYGG